MINNIVPTDEINFYSFEDSEYAVSLELCTDRTVRVQASDKNGEYRPFDPEYYMVQKKVWEPVRHTKTKTGHETVIRTDAIELHISENPFRLAVFDLDGNLLSRDSENGIYRSGSQVGIRKEEGKRYSGGIFGFGSGDHGRRSELNRYNEDFSEFSMSHGRVVAPFFMSSVGYGIFLNTISPNTTFFKHGEGFETADYLDYFFIYGPDFKTVLNEYAEITGRMELYGKWAFGFMLSKYGNDNATQAEFIEWLTRLREQGYPCDCYVFDYGWRGDVNVTKSNYSAGEKWGNHIWSNDRTKFPDIEEMFRFAHKLGFRVGLHNNAGTPEASGGDKLYLAPYSEKWVKSYMENVIMKGWGDWFWPDEFDVLGSNTAPVFSSLGAYEAWKAYTVESRPMFVTRGSFSGQHFATAWSGDIDANTTDLSYQIGFSLDTGLIGYWAVTHDLGGFKSRPTDALYARWVSEFGAWCGIMRTHGHDGREPWDFNETARNTLKKNLKIRYSLYPYLYSSAWQGYSKGVPMMRAMILEDESQKNPDAWTLNRQYYLGDFFLVAPAASVTDTYVTVWFPPKTTWYNYYTGERYEGGANGNTVRVFASLEEIPVFVKAGAIIPMGPDVNYADEIPLNPLTLDIYPHGVSYYTLYEDDGVSRRYQTEKAYSETFFRSDVSSNTVCFSIERTDYNPAVFTPCERDYILRFNHITDAQSVVLDGAALMKASTFESLKTMESGWCVDDNGLTVKLHHNSNRHEIRVEAAVISEPKEADYSAEDIRTLPEIKDGALFLKPFKAAGDNLEFNANVISSGTYRISCCYGSAEHTAGFYVDGIKIADFLTDAETSCGDINKNGNCQTYTFSGIALTEGEHRFSIIAKGSNPVNIAPESLSFETENNSVNALEKIKAKTAALLKGTVFSQNGSTLVITENGAAIKFASLYAKNKKSITLRLRSTGGTLTVYETGIGDKILTAVTLPEDGEWQTVTAECRNTDAELGDIFFEFRQKSGVSPDTELDWFCFSAD